MGLLIDQCSEMGLSLAALPSVSAFGFAPVDWSGVFGSGTDSTWMPENSVPNTSDPSEMLMRLFDRREQILTELHDSAHAIRALSAEDNLMIQQQAIGTGGDGMTIDDLLRSMSARKEPEYVYVLRNGGIRAMQKKVRYFDDP
jgi:hypothetical protein